MKPGCPSTHEALRVPPVLRTRWPRLEQFRWSLVLALGAAAWILHYFNPTEHRFYPACLFHALTGLNCPGCGSLRALHHLTHGEFRAALHCNPLLIVALTLLVLTWIRQQGWRRDSPFPTSRLRRPATAWAIGAIVIAFGVLRNVPGPAFAWMSP